MKDVTSTSFGLLIAFLLPGLAALYALSLWSDSVSDVLRTFLKAESNVGLFLLILAASLTLGLLVTVFRWFLFELWLCKDDQLNEADFAQLGVETKFVAFRAAIDEHYRYHQFWGGLTVILPFLYAGWLYRYWITLSLSLKVLSVPIFIALEYAIGVGAKAAYQIFMVRAKYILEKESRILKGG